MKLIPGLLLICILIISPKHYSQQQTEKSIPLILLKEQNNEISFEKIYIDDGKVEVISGPSVISIILPLTAGKAGNLVRVSDRNGLIIVRNKSGRYNVSFKTSDGKEKPYPSVDYVLLKTFQTRVNIMRGDGYKRAFIIENYNTIKEDNGPVIDLFGGAIPMEAGDYSITLETKIISKNEVVNGSVPFIKIDGWIVVEAKFPDGKKGRFILDTGASGNLVIKQKFLPGNIEITKLKSITYSGENSSEKNGKMLGATGSVGDDNFLGVANFQSFLLGDMILTDLKVNVLKELPEFLEKYNIVGIIGIEIMKRAEIIRIENINEEKGFINFVGNENRKPVSFDYSFPLTSAGNLLFTKGTIENTQIDFLIDLGARRSVIGSRLVNDHKFNYKAVGNSETIGLSGDKSNAVEGIFPEVKIENDLFDNVAFLISPDLFITKSVGLEKSGVILGMNFFNKFKSLEIDFINSKLLLKN